MRDQCRHRESSGSDEAGMPERNLPGGAHQQVKRQRADDRDEDLVAMPVQKLVSTSGNSNGGKPRGGPEAAEAGIEQLDIAAKIGA